MTKKSRNIIIGVSLVLLLLLIAGATLGGIFYQLVFRPQFHPSEKTYILIDKDDNIDSIYNKVRQAGNPEHFWGFEWMTDYKHYADNIHTGKYPIYPGDDAYHLLSRLLRGYQEPLNVTVGSVRTLDRLAGSLSKQLMIDSTDIVAYFEDTLLIQRLGYDKATIPALIIPDTYEMYWDITAEQLMERLQKEHDMFWNESRKQQAQAIGLTPLEVTTLASIVEEETNNNEEKPMVAGLYMNRLRKHILLQADPTVKFALQAFGRRRVLNSDLTIDSPYNTYLYPGLPPGPIRVPSKIGIEAVLNYAHHDYIFMCAKEDFSGTHNFAVTLAEHMRNARKYQQALNERKIFR